MALGARLAFVNTCGDSTELGPSLTPAFSTHL